MFVGSWRVGWSAAAWREVAVGGGGGRTLVHSGGGQSAPKVVFAGGLDFGGMERWVAVVAEL